jgi:hypothetical protein
MIAVARARVRTQALSIQGFKDAPGPMNTDLELDPSQHCDYHDRGEWCSAWPGMDDNGIDAVQRQSFTGSRSGHFFVWTLEAVLVTAWP